MGKDCRFANGKSPPGVWGKRLSHRCSSRLFGSAEDFSSSAVMSSPEGLIRRPLRSCSLHSGRFLPPKGDLMGSFRGHALPGSLFLVVGLWHVWSSLSRFAAGPLSFQVRAWNPAPDWLCGGRLVHLELYLIAGGSFLDLCIELLYSPHLHIFVTGGVLNPAHMNDFEHAGMLFMFFLFGCAALLSQTTRFLPLSESALCLLAAAAFTAEYLLFYFHSTAHTGLEGHYHLILVFLVGLCVGSAVASALLPWSFPADLCNAIAVTLQGLWFYQTAFVLYGPMMPAGCRLKDDQITCHSPGSEIRGELLANLQLFSHVLVVLAGVFGLHGLAAGKHGNAPELTG